MSNIQKSYDEQSEGVQKLVKENTDSNDVTILIAEDDYNNYLMLERIVTKELGVQVIHAVDGKVALDICKNHPKISLVLMDIKMPVMDGYTAIKLIREQNTEIPIIAQTAYADDGEKAIECGCSGFISKPFDKKSLFKVLNEFI